MFTPPGRKRPLAIMTARKRRIHRATPFGGRLAGAAERRRVVAEMSARIVVTLL
jgi:hypothetical protein